MTGKKVISRIGGFLAISVGAALAAVGWWRLWMYHGWFGPPGLLHKIWPGFLDGEGSYDAAFVEMSAILFILFVVAQVAFHRLRPQQLAVHDDSHAA